MFEEAEVFDIFRIIAGILHLGNIMFVNDPENDIVIDIANRPVLDTAAAIFGIDPEELATPLIKRSSFIRGERIFTPLSEFQVSFSLIAFLSLLSSLLR